MYLVKSPGTSLEIFQSQSRRANAEQLRILQWKRWRLYFCSSEQIQNQASYPGVFWGVMADIFDCQRGCGGGNLANVEQE
jgi:hypothetical protein